MTGIVEHLRGPHEWGYRDVAEGGFIEDRTPFEAAEIIKQLTAVLEPFAAMARVMERRAAVTFGKSPKDSDIVCESIGEAGFGILTMGHFRDAAALLPNAPGWGGIYRPPFDRAALSKVSEPQK